MAAKPAVDLMAWVPGTLGRVGLTGGIGSGKSHVSRLLQARGYAVYNADTRAKALYTESLSLRAHMEELLGEGAYGPDGTLNSAWVAGRIFAEPALRTAVSSLVHPAVFADTEAWFARQAAAPGAQPFAFKEAAILLEAGGRALVHCVVVVAAPEDLRLARVLARDGATGATEASVRARMAAQLSEPERLALADYVLHNDGQPLEPQLVALEAALHERFRG